MTATRKGKAKEDSHDEAEAVEDSSVSKPSKKQGGTFQHMGLSPSLLKAIQRKGFRLPTPIQRKCIPPLLAGRDVVGMARTGSGKTAAFVLPLLQHLRTHSLKVGVRGLVLSPSRELALQTLTVVQQLAKNTDLRAIALVGGGSLDDQFAQLATNPDIIIATPGRLMHVCVEAKLSLKTVSFVVWDEADRLLEDATLSAQMAELTARLPEGRQTALFSATLPKALVEFAQADMTDPLLVRLDVEMKLSPDLETVFLAVRSECKDALLLFLLRTVLTDRRQLTLIFAATKHHVEYLQELLTAVGLPCAYIYGALDQTARKLALEAFRSGRKPILVVTDVAARGIDVPLLDHVINFDFSPTPKLFVHRVGRVARAGRLGRAFSFVMPDEMAYLFDLQLFLGRTITVDPSKHVLGEEYMVLGNALQTSLDEENEAIALKHSLSSVLPTLKGVVRNACKLYAKTRPVASPESHRRAKDFVQRHPDTAVHPVLKPFASADSLAQTSLLAALRQYKPRQTHLDLAPPKHLVKASKPSPAHTALDRDSHRDADFYLSYQSATNHASERGYSITGGFAEQASKAVFDLGAADDPKLRKGRKGAADDRRGKRVKTEHGTTVAASFKSDVYDKWVAKSHLSIPKPGENESTSASNQASAVLADKAQRQKWRRAKPGAAKGAAAKGGRK